MKLKPTTILFITSFIPVIVFKVVARMGEATLAQAKAATAIGLILAGIQYLLSKRVLKHNTYLEKVFLGYLAVGTGWVYLTPPQYSSLFVDHSVALLYLVLFFTTFLPQLVGYDPFTYAIAKQWYPATVWNTLQFRTINLHITYFWSGIFFFAFLSGWLGHGKPLFSIVLPLILILFIALPFVKMYPNYYLKKQFTSGPLDLSAFPSTARELISRMPLGFDSEAGRNLKADIQFDLSGEGGGKMFLAIADGKCQFGEGEIHSPVLTIHAPGEVWLKMARGEMDRPKALMDGLFRVEGDMNLLMKMSTLFHPPKKMEERSLIEERSDMSMEKRGTKILAIQGSPRPKVSNTELLLKEFLKGSEAEGADTETIYLKEKDIHPCVGCYTCWAKTPGICVFKDDMPELLEKVKGCDILVYATPLYNYNMTALMKAFQERLLPLLDPHLVKKEGTYRHPQRFNINRKMVLISTCGFPELSHFDALRHIFRIMERNGEVPFVGEVLVPAAEAVLKQGHLRERAQGILKAVHRAGVEVVRDGRVSKETEATIQAAIISADEMAELANLWWDGLIERVTQAKAQEAGEKIEDMRLLLRGMAATFNGKAAGDLKATIQFEVTGKQPGQWCLSIENGKCIYREGKTDTPTLTIQTPSEVWLAIANKELNGQQAFMEGKYSAQGDMGLLMRLKSLFGSSQT